MNRIRYMSSQPILNNRIMRLLIRSISGAVPRPTGRFNSIDGYFTGFDRLHAFKAHQNAIRERYNEISGE